MMRGKALYYVHSDQLGRPELLTNSAKAIVWSANNFAFERSVTSDSVGGFSLGLPGQYFDAETGSWYNNARYYDSALGRYLQADPIGLAGGSASTYVYAAASPLMFIDPIGTKWWRLALQATGADAHPTGEAVLQSTRMASASSRATGVARLSSLVEIPGSGIAPC